MSLASWEPALAGLAEQRIDPNCHGDTAAPSSGDVIASFAYQYTNDCSCSMGQISRITFDDGRTVVYDYDKLSRLLMEEYRDAQQTLLNKFDYEYDKGGNRLQKKFDEDSSKVIWYASTTDAAAKPSGTLAQRRG